MQLRIRLEVRFRLAELAAADESHSWYGRTLKATAIIEGLGALSADALRKRTLFHRRV